MSLESRYLPIHSNDINGGLRGIVQFAILAVPFVLAAGLTLVFHQVLDREALSSYDSISGEWRRDTVIPVATTSIFFTLSTIAHVVWSQMLRARGVKTWLIYGIAAWVLLRDFWWISQSALRSPYLAVYSDRYQSIGGEMAMILAGFLAFSGIAVALYLMKKSESSWSVWLGLCASVPFVTMILIVTVTSSAGTMLYVVMFSDLCALGVLGIGNRVYRLVAQKISGHPLPSPIDAGGWRSRAGALLTVGAVVTIFGGVSIWLRQSVTMPQVLDFAIDWSIVLSGSLMVFIVVRRKLEKSASAEWAGLACLALLAIATFPQSEYLQYPASSGYLEDYSRITLMLTFWSPFGFTVMGLGLIISMLLGGSIETKSIFIGAVFGALFMFALAKPEVVRPSGHVDLLFVLEPAVVLILVCGVLFQMFGLSRAYACRTNGPGVP